MNPAAMPTKADRPARRNANGRADGSETPTRGRSRTRRGSKAPRPRSEVCRRETCGRPVTMPDRGWCTGLCRLITRQRENAQRISDALGSTPVAADLLAQAEAMDAAWGRYQRLYRELQDAARAVGMTDEQLEAIKLGR